MFILNGSSSETKVDGFVVGMKYGHENHITSVSEEGLEVFTRKEDAECDIKPLPPQDKWFVKAVSINSNGQWVDKDGVNWSLVAHEQVQ